MRHQPKLLLATVWPTERISRLGGPKRAAETPVWGSLRARGWRLARRSVLGLAILILAFAVTLGVFRAIYANRIYPGVAVGGVNLGGQTRGQAAAALQQRANQLEDGTVQFTYKGKTWSPTLKQLGVSFDVNRSLDAAFAYGREPVAWDRVTNTVELVRRQATVPLAIKWNQTALSQWFDKVDGDLGQPPHDAYLSINGTKVTIVPEVNGTIVDRTAAKEQIDQALLQLKPVAAALPVLPKIATVRTGDLTAVQQQAAKDLSQPVTLTYEGQSWSLQPSDLGQFLQTKRDPAKTGASAISLTVDQQKLGAWLNNKFGNTINKSPVNAKVAWSDDANSLIAVKDSQDGARLAPMTLAQDVAVSLLGNHQAVPIATTDLKPLVDSNNLGALGITTKLGVGDSSYVGSDPGRATNINVAAQALNGTLVPPHGVFSFNHSIGVIEPSRGYVVSQVIDGDHISTDDGGGVCQVSTTVYRASFLAGLPIVELHPHRYRIGFYEYDGWQPGIDASILQPDGDPFGGADFKFQNPTNSWMLVEAYTDNDRVYVILYGADLGYNVSVSNSVEVGTEGSDPPYEQVDSSLPPGTIEKDRSAQQGSDWVVTRVVKDSSGKVISDKDFESDYIGEGALYTVSPDMKGHVPGVDS